MLRKMINRWKWWKACHIKHRPLPRIEETPDGFYVDGLSIPYVKRNSVTAATVGDKDELTEVTLTIVAKSFKKI